jgi:hypothetical protein
LDMKDTDDRNVNVFQRTNRDLTRDVIFTSFCLRNLILVFNFELFSCIQTHLSVCVCETTFFRLIPWEK